MMNFFDIIYLQSGNPKQQSAYRVLTENLIMEILADFTPVLTGTIPINIDIEGSDLDICCYWQDEQAFISVLNKFSEYPNFELKETVHSGFDTVITRFYIDPFPIEIFGQSRPVTEQNSYRHMLIEHHILQEKGEPFRQEIVRLKKAGYKTEPAFAKALELAGDPYEMLLKLER